MLFQALHVEIEMKYLNLQVTSLVQKSVGTRSHPTLLFFSLEHFGHFFGDILVTETFRSFASQLY